MATESGSLGMLSAIYPLSLDETGPLYFQTGNSYLLVKPGHPVSTSILRTSGGGCSWCSGISLMMTQSVTSGLSQDIEFQGKGKGALHSSRASLFRQGLPSAGPRAGLPNPQTMSETHSRLPWRRGFSHGGSCVTHCASANFSCDARTSRLTSEPTTTSASTAHSQPSSSGFLMASCESACLKSLGLFSFLFFPP